MERRNPEDRLDKVCRHINSLGKPIIAFDFGVCAGDDGIAKYWREDEGACPIGHFMVLNKLTVPTHFGGLSNIIAEALDVDPRWVNAFIIGIEGAEMYENSPTIQEGYDVGSKLRKEYIKDEHSGTLHDSEQPTLDVISS